MSKYRSNLPFSDGRYFLTDGGMETDFIFHHGIDIPHFATFELLKKPGMEKFIQDYFKKYTDIAAEHNAGFILGGLTWRANNDWGAKFGYDTPDAVDGVVKKVIRYLIEIRDKLETENMPIVISGSLGPRGDGYDPGNPISIEEAKKYHSAQIRSFFDSETDIVSALTMTNTPETIGIVLAAKEIGMPIAVSFTVETDGNLPTGMSIKEAIEKVDENSNAYPAYYMINCAHPTHFSHMLKEDGAWKDRLIGIRANASKCSHEELDNSKELDDGNPVEFGQEYREILAVNPQIKIIGGCCGTDHRHVFEAAKACIQF
ncbi:homocysteine S-methyltransferase family protein [Pseudemcibacter aquimaris]|uniref:homocysteine S-methyltransferase family protein n=1 Tax=Pseudemcibacter aquimaris TaxID=2857064 RepID=UPI002012DD60|nr:homocysteine S-methyltransferase family protein [Pseudemcibacter aquimaris]MCC3862253.1 homocysteine S-methyltransferase family protein [Pseudemcibacter aquimaris]WDU59005.1 homocysteine S-methyltransferase family protein [Pseudemcibacter aquimaris]